MYHHNSEPVNNVFILLETCLTHVAGHTGLFSGLPDHKSCECKVAKKMMETGAALRASWLKLFSVSAQSGVWIEDYFN
jgi:hypothetical protein